MTGETTHKDSLAPADETAPANAGHANIGIQSQGRTSRPDLFQHRSRVRELSIILTVFGVVMLGTTLPRVFLANGVQNQIVQAGLLIFGFWFALILAALFLSNRLLLNETDE